MQPYVLYAADLGAICLLVLAVYFPRHRRRDLVAAYLGINVGVLAVSAALADSTVGAGLGLGLFGVLSIIRLRSSELAQHEVAYYFCALALGLLGGLATSSTALSVALMATLVLVMYLAGHPRVFGRHRQQVMVLDAAYTDEPALVRHLEAVLGGRVHQVTVQRVDLVNDTTLVDVRFSVAGQERAVAATSAPQAGVLTGATR